MLRLLKNVLLTAPAWWMACPDLSRFNCCVLAKKDDPYVVMTFWESEADFEAWTESAEFKEGHARSGTLPPETFTGHPKIELYEVIQSTARIESIDD